MHMKSWQFVVMAVIGCGAGLFLLLIFLGYILNIPGKRGVILPSPETSASIAPTTPSDVRVFERGPQGAPVTVIAYMDFTCAHCKTMNGYVNRLVTKYPSTLRVLWKDLFSATNNTAERIHIAARCAGEQDKFWEFRDGAYTIQPNATEQRLRVLASSIGLNVPQFSTCITRDDHGAFFDATRAEARALGIEVTPTLIMNDNRVSGLVEFTQLQQWIEQLQK